MTKEINDLLEDAKNKVKKYPYLRLGQTVFNIIYDKYPDFANSVRGNKNIDPYYKCNNIDIFLKELEKWIYESE